MAGQLFGCKPGSGGLECDIGGIPDIVSARRGSLGPGMVEVAMFLKLNKKDAIRDPRKVPSLGRLWQGSIPGRPEYPPAYFDEENFSSDDEEGDH